MVRAGRNWWIRRLPPVLNARTCGEGLRCLLCPYETKQTRKCTPILHAMLKSGTPVVGITSLKCSNENFETQIFQALALLDTLKAQKIATQVLVL